MSWKVCVRLCSIDGGSMWLVSKKRMDCGSCFGSKFMYRFTRRTISVVKYWMERCFGWFVELNVEFYSHSHSSLSSEMVVWKFPS